MVVIFIYIAHTSSYGCLLFFCIFCCLVLFLYFCFFYFSAYKYFSFISRWVLFFSKWVFNLNARFLLVLLCVLCLGWWGRVNQPPFYSCCLWSVCGGPIRRWFSNCFHLKQEIVLLLFFFYFHQQLLSMFCCCFFFALQITYRWIELLKDQHSFVNFCLFFCMRKRNKNSASLLYYVFGMYEMRSEQKKI